MVNICISDGVIQTDVTRVDMRVINMIRDLCMTHIEYRTSKDFGTCSVKEAKDDIRVRALPIQMGFFCLFFIISSLLWKV